MADPLPPPDECANCGAEIPRGAKACPECGADERTGWREESIYDGLDLPEDGPGRGAPPSSARRFGLPWYFILAGVVCLALLTIGLFVFR